MLKMPFNIIIKYFKSYIKQTGGAIAVAFAVIAPVMIGATGFALDYSYAYLVQQRLAQALDSAALAAAATSSDPTIIEQKVQEFFDVNYPPEKLGTTVTPEVTVAGGEVTVTGSARYTTFFLNLIGIPDIDVGAETVVQRQVQGLEVVLVMDNTGSMSRNDNIATLRESATNFVNILFQGAADPDHVRIGLVPYSSSVNIGPYGLGEDLDGTYYGASFVNNPHNLQYSTSDSDQWKGCVLAADYPDDTIDHEGPWDMYRYCRNEDDVAVCDFNRNGTPRREPNYYCPDTPLVPLSSNQDALLESIDTMQARGFTYGNLGMVWGVRVISPGFPFEEGSSYESEYWRKAIVMMTDGINTMHRHYSAYGETDNHDITPSDLNERFAEVCETAKEDGVLIYTVTFTGGVNESTKDYYRQCATSEDQYYDAPTQDDLLNVFKTISRELSNLHIKR